MQILILFLHNPGYEAGLPINDYCKSEKNAVNWLPK